MPADAIRTARAGRRRPGSGSWVTLLVALLALRASAEAPSGGQARVADEFGGTVGPFLVQHCVKCHGPDKQKGDVRVDDLTANVGKDLDRWRDVTEQLRDGLMPPKKEPRPDERAIRAVIAWVASAGSPHAAARLPNKGNLIPHEALFGRPADGPAALTAPRAWLLSPDQYMGYAQELARGKISGVVQPFTAIGDRGLKDFSALYSVDEQSTQILIRNAETIVDAQTGTEPRDGKSTGKNGSVGEFVKLMDPASPPTRAQLASAIRTEFRMAIGKPPSDDDVNRLIRLYDKCAADGDAPAAVRTMLQAVLLRTDAIYRMEVGQADANGRRLLAPDELARALSLALCDKRDPKLADASATGQLATREQVASQVRRMLDDPKLEKPRALRFFHEYFEYHRAPDVFKDKPLVHIKHVPKALVSDTDRLVLWAIEQDKDVLRTLLTTPMSFANYAVKKNKQTKREEPAPLDEFNKINDKGWRPVEAIYGLDDFPTQQPLELPKDTRLGILMQPSWLVAHSTNFDNDVVRRGRWVRERLLGGTVPDLPIGVVAQVPDAPDQPFRARMQVTRAEGCWKCHRRMDDLGLAFEQFDHYGRFRSTEAVQDVEATVRNVDKKGKPLGPVTREVPLDTTGLVAESGDPTLDGPVADPRQLVRKLADSPRVRQVFVRHAFRYFMGRNETLADARTLQDADRAYVDGGGSFKALVTALLTSDAFLYRSAPGEDATPPQASAQGDRR